MCGLISVSVLHGKKGVHEAGNVGGGGEGAD